MPVRETHRRGQPRAARCVLRQRVRLGVVRHLQAVLDPPQECIGRRELRDGGRRQQLRAREPRQGRLQRGRPQARLRPAADQLLRLHDELDLADAARAQLHVVPQLAPLDFAGDHRLHLAQALVDAVVEVTPIHEGPHDAVVERAVARGAGDRARLHPGVALPVAAVLLQVVLERAEVHRERSRLAERPQAHVHAEHEALRRCGHRAAGSATGRGA